MSENEILNCINKTMGKFISSFSNRTIQENEDNNENQETVNVHVTTINNVNININKQPIN